MTKLPGTVVDIETVAIPEAGSLVEPARAPSNYKDVQKIADYIRDAERRQIEDAALYPYTARIICLGWMDMGSDVPEIRICNSDATEKRSLQEFYSRVSDPQSGAMDRLITFNGLRFDLPLLQVRAMILGLDVQPIDLDRFRSPNFDVAQKLSFDGKVEFRSQKWYAKRFGLDCSDAFDGSEIAQLYADQNWDAIKSHCSWDLRTTQALAEMIAAWRTR